MKRVIGLAMGLAFSTSVYAQYEDTPGSHIRRPQPATPDAWFNSKNDAYRVMMEFGTCSVLRSPKDVAKFLALPPGSKEASKAGQRLANSECLAFGSMSFSPLLYRGALYNALYSREMNKSSLPSADMLLKLDYKADLAGLPSEDASRLTFVREFSDCVYRTNQQSVHQLLLSPPGSRAEMSIFTSLNPTLAGCLDQGRKINFSKPVLRGFLAEVAYRLSSPIANVETANVTRN